MEKMMSKTNDTSNLATLEDHDALADSELDAAAGHGYIEIYSWSWGQTQ